MTIDLNNKKFKSEFINMTKKGILVFVIGLIGLSQLFAQSNNTIVIDRDIQLIHLQDSIYVHVSWHQSDNSMRFPSNGLILIKKGQALMIDTPMDNDKTERLCQFLKQSFSVDLTTLIIGHFHDDCLGGLAYLQSIGVESIANALTIDKCKEIGLATPSTAFTDSLSFDFNGEPIECRFFGAGHSFDNITVWFPNKQLLFGGCLVKSINSRGLGNLSDAVVNNWDSTINNILKAYPSIETIIPGHGAMGGIDLLSHTIELVEEEKNGRN